jgi:glycosyltransferase involved in cell wall biosynthesis
MRILHLIHSEGVYGAELILLYLAREQQQRGHQVTIASMRDPGTPQTQFEALAATYGVNVMPLRIAPRPTPQVRGALLGCARDLQAQLLHSHGYKANILLGLVPGGARPPVVTTLHGWTTSAGFSRLRLYELLDRSAIGRLEAVVVVARSMLQLPALRAVRATRRHLIENGIPARATRLADLAAQGVPAPPATLLEFMQRAPTLLTIGRLSPEKNFAQLIEAFARARARAGTAHQLLIMGEGGEHEALLRQINAAGVRESVRLGGYLAGADRLLAHAAGFVMSSLTEGMPLVLMEALQWPVPILATAVGAVPELLSSGAGSLVPAGNLEALTAGLAALMRAPAAAPALQADARHASSRMAQEYLSLYETIT